ncbi:MAG: rRNA maturation RNase YbeY [Actinomycetota bacterium]|nr:rRNA maturation RNase YbeY [Actinomycetota bacterium]
MEILISDCQKDVPVDLTLLKRLARFVLTQEEVDTAVELSVALVDEDEIRKLNLRFRGVDEPTDVLSFPLLEELVEEPPGLAESPSLLGDVIISPQVARKQARNYGRSLEEEIALLLVHGILHLLGYDHEIPADNKIMRTREKSILNKFFSSGSGEK